MRRQSKDWPRFAADEDYVHLLDIVARSYGTLPSVIAALDWGDLMLCVRCVRARSDRLARVMKKNRKKSTVFPNISLMDLIDMIG